MGVYFHEQQPRCMDYDTSPLIDVLCMLAGTEKNKHSLPPHNLQYIIYGYPFQTHMQLGFKYSPSSSLTVFDTYRINYMQVFLKHVSLPNRPQTTKN